MVSNAIQGSRHVRHFRSPTEFAPHAAWLLTDPLLDPANCECKHCSKRGASVQKQRRQSTSIGSTTSVNTESHPSPVSSARTQRYISPGPSHSRRPTPSRAIERSLRGVSKQPSFCEVFPQQERRLDHISIPAQVSDLAAQAQGRIYRDQEIVWYILDRPWQIPEPSRPGVNRIIRFWPGIVRTVSCPSPYIASPQQSAEGDEIFYLITTPSLGRTYVVPQAGVIPFQAHAPDEDFLTEVQSMSADISLNDPNSEFDPLPRASTLVVPVSKRSESDVSPLDLLIMDIKMTKQVAFIWTMTDEFPARADPAENTAFLSQTTPKVPAHSGRTITKSSSFHSSTGEPSIVHGYRGLWWGAERIWAGDLLVLSFSESMMTYTVASSPCFVQDAKFEGQINGLPSERRKLEERYVFLKLESLLKIGTDVCMVGGLYKLVPSPDSASSHRGSHDPGLPHPLNGFTFRSVLSTNIGAKLPIKLLRGRYYPRPQLSVKEQSATDEQILRVMEGCGQTDPEIGRPTKYRWESRGSLLTSICPIEGGYLI